MVITTQNGQIQSPQQRTDTIAAALQDESVKKALGEMLPKHMDAERFKRVAMNCLRKNPKLLQCTPASFLSALLQCAAVGLEPDTPLGNAYLIPYGKEVTLVIGYEGYIDLAYRSGVVTQISANVVRAGEDFDWSEGTDPFIKHKPSAVPQSYQSGQQTYLSGRDVTHAYAMAKLLGGGTVQVVMMKAELDAIKSRSRSSHDGPWVTDPIAMYKKTAIRQLRKYMPMSAQGRAFQLSASLDEEAETGRPQSFEVPEGLFESAVETLQGETPEPAPMRDPESLQAEMEQPSEYGRCPIHAESWALGKFGFSHRVGNSSPSVYCSPSKLVNTILADNNSDAGALNEWLKATHGITKSKVEPEHLEAVIQWVATQAIAEAPTATITQPTVESGTEPWPQ